jgi:Protein of unknown function (DUF3768)
VMTPGVAALGQDAAARIIKTIAVFDDFCHANDPHEEHDFGSFEAEGHTIFFKIDYLDRSLNYHSPDPTDRAVTVRVITVMLADESDRGSHSQVVEQLAIMTQTELPFGSVSAATGKVRSLAAGC